MPVFRQINVENGLVSNTVYDIKILKNKLLCIAHERGLSTFDGVRFINYPNKMYPNISVSNIMESSKGEIFCKSFSNVFFRLKNDSLQFEFKLPVDELFHYSTIIQNTIVGTYHDSIYQYSIDDKTLKYTSVNRCTTANALKNVSYSNTFSKQNIIDNMIVMDSLMQFAVVPIKAKLSKSIFNYSFRIQDYIGVNSENNSSYFDVNNFCERNNLFANSIIYIDNSIWICTTTGVFSYGKKDGKEQVEQFFKEYNISFVQKDFENNYWFSTTNNGLLMVPNFEIRKLNLNPNNISCLNNINNKLIYGTQSGNIFSYDTKSEKSTFLAKADFEKSIDAIAYTDKHLVFSSAKFYTSNGNTQNTELFIIKDYAYLGDDLFIGANSSCYLFGSAQNLSWIKKFFNPNFKSKIPQLHKLDFLDMRIISVTTDSLAQRFYILTANGLYKMDSTLTEPHLITNHTATVSKIKWFKNTLFLSTKDKGICILNQNNIVPWEKFVAKNQVELVTNFYVQNNNLWILGESGIYKFDGDQLASFDYAFGLPLHQIKGMQLIKDTVFCYTHDALLYFLDNKKQPSRSNASIQIQSIKSLQKTLLNSQTFALAYNDNNLTIDFSLIEYSNPLNCHVEYSLNNSEKIKLGSQVRTLNLPSLSSGSYTLDLFPVSNGIIDISNKTSIQFAIATPFWKSWWFIFILILVASSLVYVRVKHILENQKKENDLIQSKLKLEKELDRSMLSSIKAQMNPHFLFNALNTIQSYIYSNEKKNASLYISKFSSLTRSILDMSTKDTISLDEELKSLNLYLELEKMRFEDSFNYTFDIAPDVNKELISIPSMLIQPYVENAIKHGLLHKKTNRILQLNFSIVENMLKITIDDNGIGRKRSQELNQIKNRQHTSFAMGANKKRLEILKNNFKQIEFEIIDKYSPLGEAIGTKVIITLPI